MADYWIRCHRCRFHNQRRGGSCEIKDAADRLGIAEHNEQQKKLLAWWDSAAGPSRCSPMPPGCPVRSDR